MFTAESVKSWSDIIAVVLLFATFAVGSVALWAGRIVSRQQEEQIRKLNSSLATQQERAATAEMRLAELQKASLPRQLDISKIAAKIQNFAGTPVSVASLGELEPALTMQQLLEALNRAQWKVGSTGVEMGIPMTRGLSRPGITVEAAPPREREWAPDGPPAEIIRDKRQIAEELARLTKAAETLVAALNEEGVSAKLHPASEATIPDGTVHVFISLRPFPGMPNDFRIAKPTR
jgi:hypothetical protein